MDSSTEILIDEDLAAFAQSAVSITVGSCDQNLRPCQVRAAGCRISSDRKQVSVFVAAPQAAAVLACLKDESAVTVVFSQPTTHRTYQLKGKCAEITLVDDADLEIMAAYRSAFALEVAPLGFAEPLIQALFSHSRNDIVSLSFSPVEVFSQTPGPNAGARIKAGQ